MNNIENDQRNNFNSVTKGFVDHKVSELEFLYEENKLLREKVRSLEDKIKSLNTETQKETQ